MIANRNLLSGGALALLSVLFLALIILSNQLLQGARLDLTQQSLYTLSTGTRHILQNLDEPIHLTLYFSDKATAESNNQGVRNLRLYYERVRELLEEMNNLANGKIKLEVVDPLAFSEAEDRAVAEGVQGLPLGAAGEKIFFGLVGANSTDGLAAIAFFDPAKESFLEYDVAKLIHDLTTAKKPKVALVSGLNMASGLDPRTMQMTDGWAVYQQMNQLFDVTTLQAANLKAIQDDVNVLVLVHPKELGEDAQYAIDQFVMRGGHLLVFVDPNAEMDMPVGNPNNPLDNMQASKASDLPLLFKAWGVEYHADQVVLDRGHALEVNMSADGRPVRHPGILSYGKADLPQDDVITANLSRLILSSPGYFKVAKDSPYYLKPLLQTSDEAMPINGERFKMQPKPEELFIGYTPAHERYLLAARLQGKFKSAFPGRTENGHLSEAKDNGEILLVADTDLLSNRLWVQIQNFFGQKVMNSFADNGAFFINALDNLSGSSDLISIRGRGVSNRPFTVVESLKMTADDRFRLKEHELETELSETERKLVELQSAKSKDQNLLLNQAQQQELDNFLKRKVQIRKELREVRRQLDADIDTLGAWLKFFSIALLPILITLGSLLYLAWQQQRKRNKELRS